MINDLSTRKDQARLADLIDSAVCVTEYANSKSAIYSRQFRETLLALASTLNDQRVLRARRRVLAAL